MTLAPSNRRRSATPAAIAVIGLGAAAVGLVAPTALVWRIAPSNVLETITLLCASSVVLGVVGLVVAWRAHRARRAPGWSILVGVILDCVAILYAGVVFGMIALLWTLLSVPTA
ncbi:hypothetical protein [Microbacterium telephonicum]|uniref:Uncharacterized protein n=1 Tax=Microbacterium telephonicum TaxID=1714841 RepID=A0A498CBS0_9MICO|nr:hypothetical protein [Microbacterium telephonicum]RLK52136.1 hypothetical protein C7474_0063 [Microbacterium telephonicum]